MRGARGALLSIEALLVSLAVIVCAVLALWLVHSLARPYPHIAQTIVDAALCGRELVIKNVGKVPAKITGIITPGGINLIHAPITLAHSQTLVRDVGAVYPKLTIVGENFKPVIVKNACYSG